MDWFLSTPPLQPSFVHVHTVIFHLLIFFLSNLVFFLSYSLINTLVQPKDALTCRLQGAGSHHSPTYQSKTKSDYKVLVDCTVTSQSIPKLQESRSSIISVSVYLCPYKAPLRPGMRFAGCCLSREQHKVKGRLEDLFLTVI